MCYEVGFYTGIDCNFGKVSSIARKRLKMWFTVSVCIIICSRNPARFSRYLNEHHFVILLILCLINDVFSIYYNSFNVILADLLLRGRLLIDGADAVWEQFD